MACAQFVLVSLVAAVAGFALVVLASHTTPAGHATLLPAAPVAAVSSTATVAGLSPVGLRRETIGFTPGVNVDAANPLAAQRLAQQPQGFAVSLLSLAPVFTAVPVIAYLLGRWTASPQPRAMAMAGVVGEYVFRLADDGLMHLCPKRHPPPAAAAPVLAAVAVAEPAAAARPAGAEVDLATLRASLGAELADLQRREDAIEHFCQKGQAQSVDMAELKAHVEEELTDLRQREAALEAFLQQPQKDLAVEGDLTA
eukprot:EG_transcript_24817